MDLASFERQAGANTSAIFVTVKQRNDRAWALKTLEFLPHDIGLPLFIDYLGRYKRGDHGERNANIWLRTRCESIEKIAKRFPIPMWHLRTETSRADIAKEWADRCQKLLLETTDYGHKQKMDAKELLEIVRQPADQWGICPALPSFKDYALRKAQGEFDEDPSFYTMVIAAISRLTDEKWWTRQLERQFQRYEEHTAIVVGKVRAGVSPYVSNKALKHHKAKKAAAQAWLDGNYVINREHDLELLLADAVAASVANPVNRRNELMVRMRGFEEYAKDNDYQGVFFTWTAPSRFHSYRKSKKGTNHANRKYTGASPRVTQKYLCLQWARCRAALARDEIEFFGFRVVEPHHDGTPHWHLLLFVKPDQQASLISIMQHYATIVDKDELMRGNHFDPTPRFEAKNIDKERGSATGYIAKYIAKNIDGVYVADDYEAESSGTHGAEGVAAWASLWGIRQFQQIGGPSVTAWRELRRIREPLDCEDILETVRRTADNGDWQRFIETMGGACLPRKDRPVQLMKAIAETTNQHGEDIVRICGVMSAKASATTHLDGWEISKHGLAESTGNTAFAVDFQSGDSREAWSSDNNCTRGSKPTKEDRRLISELKKLGIEPSDLALLRKGAVIHSSGSLVRLRKSATNGAAMLIVSRANDTAKENRTDWHDMDSIATHDAKQLADTERANLRAEAWQLIEHGGDVEDWINQQPTVNSAEVALQQLQDVLDLERIETAMNEKTARKAAEVKFWSEYDADF
ncbi:replication endonuclease [Shewanella sp.]|uniref:replication endonuclease n=1 Tax=Shewanella sp. TaxID=50422 RepID=UPI003A969DC1